PTALSCHDALRRQRLIIVLEAQTMFARAGLLAIACGAIFTAPTAAQCSSQRMQTAAAARQYAASLSPQLPSIDQLATQRYLRYGGYEQGCSTSREQLQQARIAQMQQRRDAEQARRKTAREQLPRPVQDIEKQAASKYE